jgi:addiction module HigA family antidote
MKTKPRPLLTPGEMLREEFPAPPGITPYRLAKDLGVPLTRITTILSGDRAVTADTGLRLDRYFGLPGQCLQALFVVMMVEPRSQRWLMIWKIRSAPALSNGRYPPPAIITISGGLLFHYDRPIDFPAGGFS